MTKRFIYRVLTAAVVLISLIFYLLIEFKALKLGIKYNFGFFLFLLSVGLGTLNITFGILQVSRINFLAAAFLLSFSYIYLNAEFFKLKIFVTVAVCAALFAASHFIFMLLSGGAYKYDGDNEKEGYKDYKTRLAEKNLNKQKQEEKTEETKIKSFKDGD